jgi:hypothetical protein
MTIKSFPSRGGIKGGSLYLAVTYTSSSVSWDILVPKLGLKKAR